MKYSLATLLWVGLIPVIGQPDSVSLKKVRVTPLPVITYSPETKLGFGGLVAASFNLSIDSLTTASYAQSFFLYTTNKQYNFDNSFRIYNPLNKVIYQGRFSYIYFPELYFGIETESPKHKKDLIEYNRLSGELKVYRRIQKHTYIAFATRYTKIYNVYSEPGGSFSADKPLGHDGHQILGFAPVLAYENRDGQIYPSRGYYAEVQIMAFPNWLNKSFRYLNVRVDARKYCPVKWLSERDVVALQVFAFVNSGEVPWKSMAEIGGSSLMRGYYTGYYRYNNLYAFQAEYRTALWKFIGINFWLGAAMTPEHWYSIGDSGVKPNGGIGLRFMINDKDKLNLRADYGFGKQQQRGFYLDIAEAY